MAFLRSPFLDSSASPRGIPGYRLLPTILNLCINAVEARTAGRLRCHAACGIPTPAELGGTCGIPTPAELGGSDPPCSLVAPVFRIHTAMRNACVQFRLSNQAGVDRNGKTCTRAPLKMKRGVDGGRSPPRAAPPPFLFFAHLVSNAPSFRLCFKHRVFHPPMAFLRSPFLDRSAIPRGIPGYRLLPAILNLCINALEARTAERRCCHSPLFTRRARVSNPYCNAKRLQRKDLHACPA